MDIAAIEEELRRIRQQYSKDPYEYIMTFLNYGAYAARCFYDAGEKEKAMELYKRLVMEGLRRSRMLSHRRNNENAQVCFEKTLQISREMYGLDPAQGMPMLIKALERRIHQTAILDPSSDQIMRDYRECVQIYQEQMDRSPQIQNIGRLRLAIVCGQYGKELLQRQKYACALEMYRQSKDHYFTLRQHSPQFDRPYAKACESTALCQIHMARTADTEMLLKEALDIFFSLATLSLSENLPDIARVGYHMALFLRQEGEMERAKVFCRAALGCYRSLSEVDAETYYVWHGNAAALLGDLLPNDDPEKELLYREAIEQLAEANKESYFTDGLSLAQVLISLAELLHYYRRIPEAIPLYRKAAEIYRAFPQTQPHADAIEAVLRRLEDN